MTDSKFYLNRAGSISTVLLIVSFLLICLYWGGCNDGAGKPTSDILMKFKNEGPPHHTETFHVQWAGELLQATGTSGAGSFDTGQSYSVTFNAQGYYTVSKQIKDRMPGKWKLSATGDGWHAECEEDLQPNQQTTVIFQYNQPGCV